MDLIGVTAIRSPSDNTTIQPYDLKVVLVSSATISLGATLTWTVNVTKDRGLNKIQNCLESIRLALPHPLTPSPRTGEGGQDSYSPLPFWATVYTQVLNVFSDWVLWVDSFIDPLLGGRADSFSREK